MPAAIPRFMMLMCAGLALTPAACPAAAEAVRVDTRDTLVAALRAAQPGTTIFLQSGAYAGGVSHAGLRGTKDQPIVIAAADPTDPPVIEGGGSGLHLSSPQHVECRDLIIVSSSGNGLNIDDGGSADTPAEHITLRNIAVRDIGPEGSRDGIKLSGVSHFVLDRCQVERWGRGGSAIDMVGCRNGLITGCRFKEARGEMANGVQMKGGSSAIVVQRCRFENAGGRGVNIGGSTGLAFFRPPDATFEARDIIVEDCEFLGGMAAVAFVGVDGAIVRNNTIYRPRRWALRILQENQDPRFVDCRGGRFERNIIVFRSDEVREIVNIGGQTDPGSFIFAENSWYCEDRAEATERMVRLPVKESAGTYGSDPRLKNPEEGDLTLPEHPPNHPGVRPPDTP